jgi:hypothetical protein
MQTLLTKIAQVLQCGLLHIQNKKERNGKSHTKGRLRLWRRGLRGIQIFRQLAIETNWLTGLPGLLPCHLRNKIGYTLAAALKVNAGSYERGKIFIVGVLISS